MGERMSVATLNARATELNEYLLDAKVDRVYVIGGRFNKVAVDWATREQAARFCTNDHICLGTPQECYDAMYQDYQLSIRGGTG